MRGRVLAAQITIYAALSMGLVMSLITTCFKSVMSSLTYLDMDIASESSMESVFAGYHNELLQEFDIFALGEEQCTNSKFDYYVKQNISDISYGANTTYISSEISGKQYITDDFCSGIKDQIVAYMKDGIYVDIINNFYDIEKENMKNEDIKSVSENIIDLEEEVTKLSSKELQIISLVEGIRTNDDGIVIYHGKPEITGEYFAKSILNTEISKTSTAVDNDSVYDAISGYGNKYMDVSKNISDMQEDVEIYIENCELSIDDDKALCKLNYKNSYDELKKATQTTIEKTQRALQLLDDYNAQSEIVKTKADSYIDFVNDKNDTLGSELTKTFSEDLNEIKNNVDGNGRLFDKSSMTSRLKNNLEALKIAKEKIESINENLEDETAEKIRTALAVNENMFENVSNEGLKINYSTIDFNSKSEGLGSINNIKEYMENGISSIVMSDMDLKEGSITKDDLSYSKLINNPGKATIDATSAILLNQYICDRFKCYTDYYEDEQQWGELYYPFEYIVAGNNTDRENINEVITQISLLREGMNVAYIFTDSKMRTECYTLAVSLVGATGNMVAIKAAQYLIMSIWAYGESLMDVRRLLSGECISIIKTKDDWQLSLSNLINMNFEIKKNSDSELLKEAKKTRLLNGKMCYEDYLRALLELHGYTKNIYRVAEAMELKMIYMGDENFRMYNYIYKATFNLVVRQKQIGGIIAEQYTYCY